MAEWKGCMLAQGKAMFSRNSFKAEHTLFADLSSGKTRGDTTFPPVATSQLCWCWLKGAFLERPYIRKNFFF
jgi:hypothetical protein